MIEIGSQKLFHDSWKKILPTIPDGSVDLLLTDPPYAITPIAWDKPVDWAAFWAEAHRVCKPTAQMIFFASGKFVPVLLNSNLRDFRYELIWEKTMAVGFLDANRRPMRAHEQILVFCRTGRGSVYNPQKTVGKPHKTGGLSHKPVHYSGANKPTKEVTTNLYHPRSVLKYSNVVKGKSLHPTAKPLELIEWLIRSYSNPKATVLDPFSGSFTTLAGCALTNRSGIGIERDENYFAVGIERLRQIEANDDSAKL